MWYYEIDKQRFGPLSREEIIQLIRTGVIQRKTSVWNENMSDWQKARDTELMQLFDTSYSNPPTIAPTSAIDASASPAVPEAPSPGFKNPTRLTKRLQFFLYASLVLCALSLWSNFLELQLLNDFRNGVYSSEQEAETDAEKNDNRQVLVGGAMFIVYVTSSILFLIWFHRVNYNIRKLGAQDMRFTPGWCVGWFFIPVASLWKPYQAMKETVKASIHPADWQNQTNDPLVGVWWTLLILSNSLGQVVLRLAFRADEIGEFIFATQVDMVAIAVDIVLFIVILMLVGKVYSLQMNHFQGQSQLHCQSPTPGEPDFSQQA